MYPKMYGDLKPTNVILRYHFLQTVLHNMFSKSKCQMFLGSVSITAEVSLD